MRRVRPAQQRFPGRPGGSGFPLPGSLAQLRALLSLHLSVNWGGSDRGCRCWRWQPASAIVEAGQARPEPPPGAGFQSRPAPQTLGEIVGKPHSLAAPGGRVGLGRA